MKLKFKKQPFQTEAVNAVVECFAGQPKTEGVTYRIDPGKGSSSKGLGTSQVSFDLSQSGFKNRELLKSLTLLENIQTVQRRQNLPQSAKLVSTKVCEVNHLNNSGILLGAQASHLLLRAKCTHSQEKTFLEIYKGKTQHMN
ncbi:hypothetical protein WDW89_19155 [Deltaproteobacteria bacterium TL4]